jgi:hypothetical protein
MPSRYLPLVVLFLVAPAAGAQGPVVIHTGVAYTRATREQCAQAAIHAMAKADVIHAEVTPDGNVLGWDETTTAFVVTAPYRDGVSFAVITAGRNGSDAERLRSLVRDQLVTAASQTGSATIHDADDPTRVSSAFHVIGGPEQRPVGTILKHFPAAAYIAIEKQGLGSSSGGIVGAPVAFGADANRAVFAFLLPGPNEVSTQLYVVAAGEDRAEAERLRRAIRADILKILFE